MLACACSLLLWSFGTMYTKRQRAGHISRPRCLVSCAFCVSQAVPPIGLHGSVSCHLSVCLFLVLIFWANWVLEAWEAQASMAQDRCELRNCKRIQLQRLGTALWTCCLSGYIFPNVCPLPRSQAYYSYGVIVFVITMVR